jgi:hypothetical protein
MEPIILAKIQSKVFSMVCEMAQKINQEHGARRSIIVGPGSRIPGRPRVANEM